MLRKSTINNMKKALVLPLLMITAVFCFSQSSNSGVRAAKIDYLQISKNQKIAGWILFGGGTVLAMVGTAKLVSNSPFNEEPFYKSSGGAMIVIGAVSILGSVPLFISSVRNKRKGTSLSLKNEYNKQIQKGSIVLKAVPSLSLKIEL